LCKLPALQAAFCESFQKANDLLTFLPFYDIIYTSGDGTHNKKQNDNLISKSNGGEDTHDKKHYGY
jgi:hypothetical protein